MGFWSKVESEIESLAAKIRALDGTPIMNDAEEYLVGLINDLEKRMSGSPIAELVISSIATQLSVELPASTAAAIAAKAPVVPADQGTPEPIPAPPPAK